jgi:hypothetical protein
LSKRHHLDIAFNAWISPGNSTDQLVGKHKTGT